MSKKINVTLYCPTCGQSDFNHNEDKSFVKCNNCEREFHRGINELIEFNQTAIENEVQNYGQSLLDDFGKKLASRFKNNIHLKFKK
ncbi:hypothetical protein [Sphingobacterium sp. BS-2]|uniref:ECs_2282 family putative zinc-binding protein n=1 Tax=Sphingobacterium sp. BS-2 TaxID=3377129 RepID=UPI0038FC5CCC